MRFLYNYPSGAILGTLAALALFIVAGTFLWNATGSKRLRGVLTSILFVVLGATLMAVSLHTLMVQKAFWVAARSFVDLPSTSPLAITAGSVVLAALVGLVVVTIVQRRSIALLGSLTVTFGAFACLAETVMMNTFNDNWALANTYGWNLTAGSLLALLLHVAIVKIRDYGRGQYQRGQLAALDHQSNQASTVS